MRPPLALRMGDILELKKGHPCGENRWEVTRLGADIRLKCLGCGRLVMLPRSKLERRIKRFLESETPGPSPP